MYKRQEVDVAVGSLHALDVVGATLRAGLSEGRLHRFGIHAKRVVGQVLPRHGAGVDLSLIHI